jgi:hypothetical protein
MTDSTAPEGRTPLTEEELAEQRTARCGSCSQHQEIDRLRAENTELRAELSELTADTTDHVVRHVNAAVSHANGQITRLAAENTALAEDRDVWKGNAIDAYLLAERRATKRKAAADDEMRREIVLREINQGALAGMSSEITGQAADLVLNALNAYDAWKADTTHWEQSGAEQAADRDRAAAALGGDQDGGNRDA